MMRLKKLLGKIFVAFKSLSRKAFTKGLVIVSAGMVTVLLMGTNGFSVNSKTNPEPKIEQTEEENINEATIAPIALPSELVLPEPRGEQSSKSNPTLQKEVEDTKTVFQTASNNVLGEEKTAIYTEEEYMALAKIVEAEATGQDIVGKILIVNVVLNRVKSDQFPDTIMGVIYERYHGKAQFSPVDDGRMDSLPITESTYEAVNQALQGEDYSSGATFFVAKARASKANGSWFDDHLKLVKEHGAHFFYAYY